MEKYDFSGWATRNDLLCGDGRTIRKNAFKENDGKTVPLVWNHDHANADAVLGHALLENRDDGVYAYCKFNDTEQGKNAKALVEHGDVRSLSIYANQLKQIGKDVIHGSIRELSLVLAGANPGAFIDFVMAHSDEEEDSMIANYDENAITLYHSSEDKKEEPAQKPEEKENKNMAEETKKPAEAEGDKTVGEVWEGITKKLSETEMNVVYAMIGQAAEGDVEDEEDTEDGKDDKNAKHSEDFEGGNTMKNNVFDKETQNENKNNVLTHADQEKIIAMAKTSGVGSLQDAIRNYLGDEASLAHSFDEEEMKEVLFPEYKDVRPGAPELLQRDHSWVDTVMSKAHKSPISRIRTRQADARIAELRAQGYKKGEEKKISSNIRLLSRTTDPQTVYRKDMLNRDDIVDITDFNVVEYQWNVMKQNLNEEIAIAAMIGDGREDGDPDKIHETHIRSVWNDEELYTIHKDVDIEAARAELQGTNTGANFGENYIYAEAIISAALYAREQYKGSGTPDLFCTPHLLNVMLLARDLNGRRIYDSKADLAAALNVAAIHTAEQFEGKTRTTTDGKKKKLLGLFVNMADYQFGCTKGGEITKFDQFDIDFNQYKYLIETRLSGALTKPYAAIALEENVVDSEG
jgi:hypothetical protein